MREVNISKKYKLNEDGHVIDIKTGFVKEISKSKRGYRILINGKEFAVHQLVMQYFGEPQPNEHYVITHINGNLYDNRIENLKWVTRSEAKCTLPEGLRKCDFENESEYNTKMAEIHRKKHGHEDNEKRRIKYKNDEAYRNRQIETAKRYQTDNYDKCVERQKQWQAENKEKYRERIKKWRSKNRKKYREKEIKASVDYHRKNKERTNYNGRVYYSIHKEEILKKRKKKRKKS